MKTYSILKVTNGKIKPLFDSLTEEDIENLKQEAYKAQQRQSLQAQSYKWEPSKFKHKTYEDLYELFYGWDKPDKFLILEEITF